MKAFRSHPVHFAKWSGGIGGIFIFCYEGSWRHNIGLHLRYPGGVDPRTYLKSLSWGLHIGPIIPGIWTSLMDCSLGKELGQLLQARIIEFG